jgi:hypothetical protein
MSLHAGPVLEEAHLPDGRLIRVRVGLAEDPYIDEREIDTVVAELRDDEGRPLGVVTTVLDADEENEARALARDIVRGLETGELEPTAGSIEPLAEELR